MATLPEDNEGVAILLQDSIDKTMPVEDIDFQLPRAIEGWVTGPASQFELKVGNKVFWVTVEEGF